MKRDVGVAYLLFLAAGWFGAHRFYLGHRKSGTAMAVTTIGTPVLLGTLLALDEPILGWGLFVIGWGAVAVTLLVDVFHTADMAAEWNDEDPAEYAGGRHRR